MKLSLTKSDNYVSCFFNKRVNSHGFEIHRDGLQHMFIRENKIKKFQLLLFFSLKTMLDNLPTKLGSSPNGTCFCATQCLC